MRFPISSAAPSEEVLKIGAAYDKRRVNSDGRERSAIGGFGKRQEEQRLT
jgi:hypothetical protein